MNTNRLRVGGLVCQSVPRLTSVALALSMAFPASAATLTWTGDMDTALATAGNWTGSIVGPLANDTLSFSALPSGTYPALNNSITAALHKLAFSGGNYSLTGSDLTLTPVNVLGTADTSILSVTGGTHTIDVNGIVLKPLVINRTISQEIINSFDINVGGGGVLNLNAPVSVGLYTPIPSLPYAGNVPPQPAAIRASVDTGSTLNLNGAVNNQPGSLSIFNNGSVGISNVLNVSTLSLSGTGQTTLRDNGAITWGGQDKLVSLPSTTRLALDNSGVIALNNRLGGAGVTMKPAAMLELVGNATTGVTEQAGKLTINGVGTLNSADSVIRVNANGQSTVLSFSELAFGTDHYVSADATTPGHTVYDSGGRVDFQTNGSFGGNARIIFTQAPASSDGLINGATVNSHEFAAYDSTLGVLAATTANSLASSGSGDNVFLNGANETITGAISVHSLAGNNATVQGTGQLLTVGSGRVLLNGSNSIGARLDFGSRQGQLDIRSGQTDLQGGLQGSNGAVVTGAGNLTISGVSSLAGTLQVKNSTLTLANNDVLQGAGISLGSTTTLAIGNTTQTVSSLSGGRISGNGTLIATGASGINTSGSTTANLQATNGTISLSGGVASGNITAQNISLSWLTATGNIEATSSIEVASGTLAGQIAGAASLTAQGSVQLTGQSLHTGASLIGGNGYPSSLVIHDNGALASTTGITVRDGSLLGLAYNTSGATASNRINDTAYVNLGRAEMYLIEQGAPVTQTIEKIGALTVTGNATLNLQGNVGVLADSLSVASGKRLMVNLGDSGSVKFVTPPVATDGAIMDGVVASRTVTTASTTNGNLYAWATYSAANGIQTEHAAGTLASAGSGVVRVTDAVNQAVNSAVSVGGAIFDTTQAVTGSGTLSTAKGLVFFKDNTLSINQVQMGGNSILSNAGRNTITSAMSGSSLDKLGQGTIELTGVSTFNDININEGVLVVSGTLNANVHNAYDTLVIKGLGNVNGHFDHATLDNATLTIGSGSSGSVKLSAGSSVTNNGYANIENNGGYVSNSGSASIYSSAGTVTSSGTGSVSIQISGGQADNQGTASMLSTYGGSMTNHGTADYVDVAAGSFTNRGTVRDQIVMTGGTLNNNTGASIGVVATAATPAQGAFIELSSIMAGGNNQILNNAGSIYASVVLNGGTINNSGTFELLSGGTYFSDDLGLSQLPPEGLAEAVGQLGYLPGTYTQTAGKTTIDGTFAGNIILKGGILNGYGVIGGTVTASAGAKILPGHSPGIMEIQNLVLEGGSILELDVTANGSDNLVISGQLDAKQGSQIIFKVDSNTQASSLDVDNYFTLGSNANWSNVSFLASTSSGSTYALAVNADGTIASVTSVPEPETYAMMLAGLGLVGACVRRQRKAMAA